MEESELDKSELPTTFKLTRARRKGVVARGNDLGFLAVLAASLGYFWISGPQLWATIRQSVRLALVGGPILSDGRDAMFAAVDTVFSAVARQLVLLTGIVFLTVLLFELVQTGFVYSTEPLKLNFGRLNPVNGLKRLFSLRLLIETIKNVLKLGIYSAVGYFVIRDVLQSDIPAITDGRSLSALMANAAFRLVSAYILVALLFAVVDQIIARRDFLKRMRMSRRELRRETREREGEPRIKQKRKQMHGEFSKASKSIRGIRKADVLITNPEHVAIGLHYDARSMQAPTAVAVGTNYLAQRLKRIAFVYGIPIIENPTLARSLYRHTALNSVISENCFKPVADIYNDIRRKRGKRSADEHA
jgi:flagellar biosynthetic protein FlhB